MVGWSCGSASVLCSFLLFGCPPPMRWTTARCPFFCAPPSSEVVSRLCGCLLVPTPVAKTRDARPLHECSYVSFCCTVCLTRTQSHRDAWRQRALRQQSRNRDKIKNGDASNQTSRSKRGKRERAMTHTDIDTRTTTHVSQQNHARKRWRGTPRGINTIPTCIWCHPPRATGGTVEHVISHQNSLG